MIRSFATLGLAALPMLISLGALAGPGALPDLTGQALRVEVVDSAPPFSKRLPDGSYAGFNVDLAGALCRVLHAICTLSGQPFAAIIDHISAGQADIALANLLRTPEREALVLFSAPVWRSSTSLVGAKDAADLDLAEAVHSRRIGVRRGSRQFDVLSALDAAKLVPVATTEAVWQVLRDGTAELGIAPTLYARHFVASPEGQGFKTMGDPITGNGLGGSVHIVFPPGRADLKAAIDQAIMALRQDGSYQALSQRYFSYDIF
ncbi:MAG: transporter substrate-binding domain-containing protein [Azospirillum sp.]|nr:transporter substrate-binding domain-containing protein [Azospirillum sp.]